MGRKLRRAVRTGVSLTTIAVTTSIVGFTASPIAKVNPRSPWIQRLVMWWARMFMLATGVDLEVRGRRMERGRSFVFVSNHASALDIPVHFLATGVPIRFLTKKELFRVPVLGFLLRSLSFIKVDRQARAAALDDVNSQVRDAIELDLSLMIYPEGTRTTTGELGTFKKGAFRIAIDHGMPVVPMAVLGTGDLWPPGSKIIWDGTVLAMVGEPIETAHLTRADVEALRDEVHAWVAKTLEQLADSRQS